MTKINRLTQIPEAQGNDIIPIWDYSENRTRGVLASTLKEYVAADEVVDAKIVDDHLILITKDGQEIDAGKLPSSDGIDLQNDGNDIGEFSTLNFGEGLTAKPSETFGVVAEIDIDKDKVYTKDVDLPIEIDDLTDITKIKTGSGIYSLKKDSEAELVNRAPFSRILRFDQSITLNEPYDGLTAIYATEDTAADDIFHLNIDPDDPRINKDWVFTVAIDSDITKSKLECKIGKTNPTSFNLSTGFAVLELDSQKGEFVIHNQSSTVTGDLPSAFCDLSNSEWKNIPSKEWIVRDGTLSGFGTGIDGKTARLRCQVSNSSISTTEIGLRAIEHVYTIISDDDTINGRVFARSSKSKSTFDSSTLREETNSAGSGSITIDGNSADKIVSGDGIETTFDPATNTSTIIAKDFDQPDVAGFGTVSELPRHLIKTQFDIENLTYSFDEDRFNARFANGEAGPSFKITAQKLEHTKWEIGFTYNERLTSYQTVMSRMLIQFLPNESTGTFDDLANKVDFRCEKGIGGVFKHKHEGQDLLELWCIAATDEFPNRFFIELDLSANNDKYVFNTREPQFTEYLFPWNDINKPPQFVQLEEGMNNQGKMGSGSNIDSSSVTQGKVYVDDFTPSNGGPEGLEGSARKGYVIKHYGFNDQETASVIWFYNFVGDIYVKMNQNQFDKGRWNKITGSRFANTRTFILEGAEREYLEVDRTTPVITTEEIDGFVLIRVIASENENSQPKIERVLPGQLASGFSLCQDNTAADSQIIQISSGTYSLSQMTFAIDADIGDGVYVDENGKLSLIRTRHQCGWVIEGGVIIDVDLYNKTVKSIYDDFPEFKTIYLNMLGSDNVNFMSEIYQDGNLNTTVDATRAFRLKIKNTLDGSTSEVFYADENQAQFLMPILQGVDPVALKKDLPLIPDNGYVEKYTTAELGKVQSAYDGKYGDERAYYPVAIYQDVNGWTQFNFTGNMQFKYKNKDTGIAGDKILELRPSSIEVFKKATFSNDAVYTGDTSQPDNLINREALEKEAHQEWFFIANGLLDSNGNRPTGGSGADDTLLIWHESVAASVTNPINEFKIKFDGAYEKVKGFSKGLRYRLSQQNGTVNQYWETVENGWVTNGNVWHLTADKVDGDDLEIGVDTEIHASYLFLDDAEFSFHGEGLGVPKVTFLGSDEVTQSGLVGHYLNTLNQASSVGRINLNNSEGNTEFRVIIDQANRETRDYRISLGPGNALSEKRIRVGERWECRVYVDWNNGTNSNFFWTRLDDGTAGYILQDEFNSKSGYNKLISGGGSTRSITYSENGSILKISNSTIKVQLLEGMSEENPHGYIKYINSRNSDVNFEWYDRNGNQVTNNVPSVCPANTVVEIFADYSKDEYVLNFGQSKVINSINEEDQLMEGLAQGFIYAKSVSVG